MEFNATITALASGLPAAVAVIRISGSRTLALLDACFAAKDAPAHRVVRVGRLTLPDITDTATAVFYKAPHSYTGEDMAEITIHGSKKLAESLITHLINHGAEAAKAGEFTRRALLNGKLDLAKAEGVLAMINAGTDSQLKAAHAQLSGELSGKISEFQQDISAASAALEVLLDFPEEDLNEDAIVSVAVELRRLGLEAQTLASTYRTGRLIKDGVSVAIVGSTNVGKSSLLNALTGRQRAIVTDTAGTTRDTLDAAITINDMQFVLTDTAGLRQTADKIESIGIERSKSAALNCDILLAVCEAGSSLPEDVLALTRQHPRSIIVDNKVDIMAQSDENILGVSAVSGEGLEELKKRLYLTALDGDDCEGLMLTELRHFSAVSEAAEILLSAAKNVFAVPADCLAADLMAAYNALGRVTGASGSEEIIDQIFSKFCVGK